MKIWVDADACPKAIKDILFRAAKRVKVSMTLVANLPMQIPKSEFINFVLVESGLDVADNYIANQIKEGDLVITADIPLAAEIIEKDGHALNPRGEFYTKDNVKQRLSMRNLMNELRSSGLNTGGPPILGQRDRQAFANELDKFLMKNTDN